MLNPDSKEYKEIKSLLQTFIKKSNKLENDYNKKERAYRNKKDFNKNNKMIEKNRQIFKNSEKVDDININTNSRIIAIIYQDKNNYSVKNVESILTNNLNKIRKILR